MFSSLGSSAAQNLSAGFRSHPDKKAMGPLSFGICLIGQSLFHS
jgi:hypothetical protein